VPTVGAAVRGRGELYELDTVAGDGGARDASAGEVRSSECSRRGAGPLCAAVGVGDLTHRPRCNTTVDYENFLADDRLGPRAGFQTTRPARRLSPLSLPQSPHLMLDATVELEPISSSA